MQLSGELAKTLLELAPDPSVVVDDRGVIVFANNQTEQAFGYRPAELIGKPVEALMPERFRKIHPEHRARFSAEPHPRPMGAGLVLYGVHKSGREFPVEISLSPVKTSTGLFVVSAIRDATVHRDTERQLVEANRAKSQLLAAASHDLRQPLQTLNLLNRVAAGQAGDNAPLKDLLARQQRALDSMSALLSSVLDISKLDSGAVVAQVEVCRIDGIFDGLRSDFEPQAAEKGLDFLVTSSPEAATTDPELMRRLLGNLLSNAVRYTERGAVRLACLVDGSKLRIEVGDTGSGIAPAEIDRIFDEFYQADSGAERPDGLGLGLSIVRRLSALLGCDVAVESTPGKGTVFTVVVPRAKAVGSTARAADAASEHAGGHILIVDDEPAVAEATGMLLELEGFEISVASCTREAVDGAGRRAPDLVVVDYHLRGSDTGIDVVSALRDFLRTPVPALFLTGDTGKSALAHTKVEHSHLLSKPARADELLAVIHQMLAVPARAGEPER